MSKMKFKVGNDIDVDGCLQGEIVIDYKDLVRVFGEYSNDGDQCKVDAEWCIAFEDGVKATIYNWKDGHNYNEGNGLDVCDIENWHIGGKDKKSLQHVIQVLLESRGLKSGNKLLQEQFANI